MYGHYIVVLCSLLVYSLVPPTVHTNGLYTYNGIHYEFMCYLSDCVCYLIHGSAFSMHIMHKFPSVAYCSINLPIHVLYIIQSLDIVVAYQVHLY